jgi:hypothetical protein
LQTILCARKYSNRSISSRAFKKSIFSILMCVCVGMCWWTNERRNKRKENKTFGRYKHTFILKILLIFHSISKHFQFTGEKTKRSCCFYLCNNNNTQSQFVELKWEWK